MELSAIVKQISLLGDWFGVDLSESRILGYSLELQKIPDDKIQRAIHRAKMEEDFFPSFAKLLTLSGSRDVCLNRLSIDGWLRECRKPSAHQVGQRPMCVECYADYQVRQLSGTHA